MGTSNYNTAPSPISSFILGAVICSAILLATLPGGNLINLAVSIVFVGVILFNAIAGKRALWFSPELLILVAWMCYSMIGPLLAADTAAAMFKSLTVIQVFVLAFCVQQVIIWNRGPGANLVVYGVAGSISYLITFTQFSAQEIAGAEDVAGDVARVASTLNDENTFGAVALMGVSLALMAIAKNTKKAAVLPLGILLVFLIIAVVNSGSRTAFLGGLLLVAGAMWAFRLWRGATLGRFLFFSLISALVFSATFYVAKSIPEVEDRIEAVFSSESVIVSRVEGFFNVLVSGDTKAEKGSSIDARVSMVNEGLNVISNYPIAGAGLDNFRTVTGAGTYAHSNIIEVATSTGLIGFVIYYTMYIVLTICIFCISGSLGTIGVMARLAIIGLMAYFLMDITRVSYYEKTSWLYFAMLGALLEVYRRDVKEERAKDFYTKKGQCRRKKKHSGTKRSDGIVVGYEDIDDLFSKNT